jgi:hypothetical protein
VGETEAMRRWKFLKKPLSDDDLTALRAALATVREKFRAEPSCDFCGDEKPEWVYAASQHTAGLYELNWRWAACTDCSVLLDTENLDVMENKLVFYLTSMTRISPEIVRLAAQLSLEEFRRYAIRVEDVN